MAAILEKETEKKPYSFRGLDIVENDNLSILIV